MTHDFYEDAVEACNREQVPFVFAIRVADGVWRVDHNLTHQPQFYRTMSKEEEVLSTLEMVLKEDE